MVLPFI